jgi:UDP-N-acetylmuramoyl-tripeptide--D-alanyl-D-alanine ligase
MKVWPSNLLSLALNLDCSLEGGAIKINSQLIEPGNIFIALNNGHEHDGHNYVNHAIEMGANLCIVNKSSNVNFAHNSDKLVKVEDTKQALIKMAEYKRQTTKAKIISVTGSTGKTSTKNLIYALIAAHLTKKSTVFAGYKNFNNFLGTTINLASLSPSALYGVFEVGMQEKGEIDEIAKLLKPQTALITNIGPVHLKYFSDINGIAQAKSEIMNYMELGNAVILNNDSSYLYDIKNKAKSKGLTIYTYGKNKNCDLHLVDIKFSNNKNLVNFELKGEKFEFQTYFLSEGSIYNILGSILCIHILGLDIHKTIDIIPNLNPSENRGEIINVKNKELKILDFSYNASPISVENNLSSFMYNDNVKRRVLILGDMLELGKDEAFYHTSLLPSIIKYKVDKLITVGKLSKLLYAIAPKSIKLATFLDADELNKHIQDLVQPKDLIMIQGSFGIGLKKVVNFLSSI